MKKYMKQLTLLSLLPLAFTACGGGEASFEQAGTVVVLEQNVPISVNPGDTLTQTSDDTRISVTHDITNDTKEVTLLAGSAELLRGDYEIK